MKKTVLWWGRFDPAYSRNRVYIALFKELGWDVRLFPVKYCCALGDLEWLIRGDKSLRPNLVWVPVARQRLRERFSHGGEDIDAISDEQWRENFYRPELKASYELIYPDIAPFMDTTSKADYYEKRRPAAIETIRECLILNAVLGRDADPTSDRDALRSLRAALDEELCGLICEKGAEN